MMRCGAWRSQSHAFACIRCRQLGSRQPHYFALRSYSNGQNSSSAGSSGPSGNWAAPRSPSRLRGPQEGGGGWGGLSKTLGASQATGNDSPHISRRNGGTNEAGEEDDGLLPHERAARQRIAGSQSQPQPQLRPQSESASEAQPPSNASAPPVKGGLASHRAPIHRLRERKGTWRLETSGSRGGNIKALGGLDDNIGAKSVRHSRPPRHPHGSARRPWDTHDGGRESRHGFDGVRNKTDASSSREPAAKQQSRGRQAPVQSWTALEQASTKVVGQENQPQDDFWAEIGDISTARKQRRLRQESELSSGEWGLLSRSRRAAPQPRSPPATRSSDTSGFWERFKQHVSKDTAADASDMTTAPVETWETAETVETEPVVEPESTDRERRRDLDKESESYVIERDPRKRSKELDKKSKKKHGASRRSRFEEEEDDDNWDEGAERRAEERRRRKAERKARREMEAEAMEEASGPAKLLIPEFINLTNLASALKLKPDFLLNSLQEMGFENLSSDSIFTGETAALVAMEFGFDASVDMGGERDLRPRPPPEDVSSLPPRPPVVTIMGHVDHGKTTLLDWLRKSSIAAQEHGGITQHIGAFMVKMSSAKSITFLDTPGHAAFLTMRQRGANVTDIVVLVVASDDSVKPQTLEALKHARAAQVPMIVAISKIDKPDARPDQVKADLARHGVEIEDFGGDVQVVCVSGKTGQGMEDLEENIITLSEILDVRAEQDGMAEGHVLEASIKQHGKSATILVKRGTLRPGDSIVAGTAWARIRVLRNEAGVELAEAPPGTPVEVLGWRDELPGAGDEVIQAPDEDGARTAIDYRLEMRYREQSSRQLAEQEQRQREKEEAERAAAEAEEDLAGKGEEKPGTTMVNFTVKGDVVGSVEAVCATIQELGNHEVQPRILRSSAGQVSEFDVEHAATSRSTIVNFNNAIPSHVKRLAEDKGVQILDHTVIYHLSDEVRQTLSAHLSDTITHKVIGEAEILQIFPINVKGRTFRNIAGCRIRNGMITRSGSVRVLRRGEKIFDGKIDALRHGKKDVTEMRKGTECGISFEGFEDFQVGDHIQTYEEVREKRTL